jgi:hypothetical protein
MTTIVKMIFGSHLYGTNTANSDTDLKGVFMPTREQVILQRVPKSINQSRNKKEGEKNTAADVDFEMYSLNYFLHLALEGETVALDMLHAPLSALQESSGVWTDLVWNREKFYTKNLKSFVGYARRQAAKYGVKGSRLSEATMVLDALKSFSCIYRQGDELPRVGEFLDRLPKGEHISIQQTDQDTLYNVCGKSLSSKARIDHYIPMLQNFVDTYGARAKEAAENKGIDWKAVSHAFRAAYQVRHILKHGGYTYPLPETDIIREVKSGINDWHTVVQPELEVLMDEVEKLSRESNLPEKPDRSFWDQWLIQTIEEIL